MNNKNISIAFFFLFAVGLALTGMFRKTAIKEVAAPEEVSESKPVADASRRVGHSRPSITLDIYGHLIPGMQGEVAEGIDDLVLPTAVALH